MTPELKHALEVIKAECEKHDKCNKECQLYMPAKAYHKAFCPIAEGYVPAEVDIDRWEKENDND